MAYTRYYRAQPEKKHRTFRPGALRCWRCDCTVAKTREAYENRAKLCDSCRERCMRDGSTGRADWRIVYTGPVQESLDLGGDR